MADALQPYRDKRRFGETPEPGPAAPAPPAPGLPRFVVHEHHARSMHWDLRLERAGVLVCWAVPKGIPDDPADDHLAVHTEDHPIEYLDFAGEIPAGNYGAGRMAVWDAGTYSEEKFRADEVIVRLHGERARGRYSLFRTHERNWMIHRMDPAADPGRRALPESVAPMLAEAGPLPEDPGWAFEIKWDGLRALAFIEGGRLRLLNRTGRDVTARYPELRDLGRAISDRRALLDGEIIAPDGDGRPDFGRLQSRMHVASDAAVRRRARDTPVVLMLFDLLHLDGRDLTGQGYAERRAALAELGLSGPAWQTPAHHVGDGAALLEAARAQGLEGIVAKRLDASYEPGRRSGAWRKVRLTTRQELVVGGWMPGEGNRASSLGALLVGYRTEVGGPLRYAGRVGTGFDAATLRRLTTLLEGLAADSGPFLLEPARPATARPPRGARWVRPELVAEVRFASWTHLGILRHPSFQGLRDDRDPDEVVLERGPEIG